MRKTTWFAIALFLIGCTIGTPAFCTITDVTPRAEYTAAGGATYQCADTAGTSEGWPVWNKEDLRVWLDATLQVVDTDYTVTFTAGDANDCAITFVVTPTAGQIVTMERDASEERASDFATSGPFSMASMNDQLDYLTTLAQDNRVKLNRTARLDPGEEISADFSRLPQPEASKILGYAEDGSYANLAYTITGTWDGANLADYTVLRNITGQIADDQSLVAGRSAAGDGGGGVFVWDSSDLSLNITADTSSGIYVAPTADLTGASGAWVRIWQDVVFLPWFGTLESSADNLTAIQGAIDFCYSEGGCTVSGTPGTFIFDASSGTSYDPVISLKTGVTLTGPKDFILKAKDSTYATGNPALIGNDQTLGVSDIHVIGFTIDANATNNVETTGGAISVLFGRPIGPSGGPGEQGVTNGSIADMEFVDVSFMAVGIRDGSDKITVSNIRADGGYYAVQASNSTQIDINGIISTDVLNNAVDVYGDVGVEFTISGRSGTFTRGETITGGSSGATGRLYKDVDSTTLWVDALVGTFTGTETITGGVSGSTATYDSQASIKGDFSGTIRGVQADGCLTGIFLETVSDVTVSDCVIKNPTGNGLIINRIHSITSGNRVVNLTVVDAALSGVLLSGQANYNYVEASINGATNGVRFNGSNHNTVANCILQNVTTGYLVEGSGIKNKIRGGMVGTATTGVDIGASQTGALVDRPEFQSVTTRLVDLGPSTVFQAARNDAVIFASGASNVTPNMDNGNVVDVTDTPISANITVNAPSGSYTTGAKLILLLKQDGTGGYTVTFNSVYRIKTAASTTATKHSHYTFVYNGTFWESVGEVIDF